MPSLEVFKEIPPIVRSVYTDLNLKHFIILSSVMNRTESFLIKLGISTVCKFRFAGRKALMSPYMSVTL